MEQLTDSFDKILEDIQNRTHLFAGFDWANWGKAISNIIYTFYDVIAWFKKTW
ncbi:MAG: hypothetical protein K6C36_03900 [Clostridia bacterium]|nr:hypothetical protein [Clostridia bacterium]